MWLDKQPILFLDMSGNSAKTIEIQRRSIGASTEKIIDVPRGNSLLFLFNLMLGGCNYQSGMCFV